MVRKPDTWMPLYVGDYLADTRHLRLAEHGAYLLLIMAYWRAQKPLPDDDERLSRICGLTKSQWKPYRDALAPFFQITSDGWSHKKIEALLVEALDNAQRNASRASRAATKRWSKDAPSNAPSMPQAMLNECPSPSPSSSSVANATGADAPSLKDAVWKSGVDWLIKRTGRPENQIRTLVGKWMAGGNDAKVYEAFQQAFRNTPVEPVAYIEKLLAGSPKNSLGNELLAALDAATQTEARNGH